MLARLAQLLLLVAAAGCSDDPASPPADRPAAAGPTLELRSPAFEPGRPIPSRHTGEGEDVSPALTWTGLPDGTVELALVVDDPDAPRAEPWVHWVVYGIPADRPGLPEGSADGAIEGRNDWGTTTWQGPLPPTGHGVHRYRFRLYALSAPLGAGPGLTAGELLERIEDLVLAAGILVGTFERR